jgi:hypothetical protein
MHPPHTKSLFDWPIRSLLMLLVLVSLLPALAVMLYSGLKNHDYAVCISTSSKRARASC